MCGAVGYRRIMNSESYPPEWRRAKMISDHILEEWAYDVFDPVVGYYQTKVWVRLRVTGLSNKQWEIVLREWVVWEPMINVHTVDEAKAVALAMLATE